ncbi:MAG: ATP-grasp domain-containing protein [Dehalococcoidales bacterium]|nr:ATP-grasp domain-containing protein [Dehalococcoidales bacterium]
MRIAILYNKPLPSRYDCAGEEEAVTGVLDAVDAVYKALSELGYNVVKVSLAPPLTRMRKRLSSLKAEVVFNLFEGFCGQPDTEALVPEILSETGIPYTGCGGKTLKLALDKVKVKQMLTAAGIPTPDYQLLTTGILDMFRLNYPCIVKPSAEDASHGVTKASIVGDFVSLKEQVKLIEKSYDNKVLVEEFLDGQEFNATVMGNVQCVVLPVSEIVYNLPAKIPRILTFAAKWKINDIYFQGTKSVCPAQIDINTENHIKKTAMAAFHLLGCQGYARVDMRMDKAGTLNIIEVNPNPDISPGAGSIRQAETASMNYPEFVDKILRLAMERAHGH